MNTEQLLSSFPKTRPSLSADYQKIYEAAYLNSREGESTVTMIALRLEQWMHRKVACNPQSFPVLEIGAGTLNHLAYEKIAGPYDVIEPFKILYEGKEELKKIRAVFSDIAEVPRENSYNRILSVAVLEHLTELPAVIAKSALLLASDGEFRAGIPSEGGLFWFLAWRFGTGLGFWLRHKLSYKPMMKHEHVNTAVEIESVVRHFYRDVEIRRSLFGSRNLSFYTYIKATKPKTDMAQAYLENLRK